MHPDTERLADQVVLGYETPTATVVAVVAVVAHHEILPFRDLDGTIGQHTTPRRQVGRALSGQDPMLDLAELLERLAPPGHLGPRPDTRIATDRQLRDRLAVAIERFVLVSDLVARNRDHALDVVDRGVLRELKDHHVADLRIADREEFGVEYRPAQPVGELVDQDEIAGQQRRHHGVRRDTKGFDQKGAQHQNGENDRKEGARILDQKRLLIRRFRPVGERAAADGSLGQSTPTRREHHRIDQPDPAGHDGCQHQKGREIEIHG